MTIRVFQVLLLEQDDPGFRKMPPFGVNLIIIEKFLQVFSLSAKLVSAASSQPGSEVKLPRIEIVSRLWFPTVLGNWGYRNWSIASRTKERERESQWSSSLVILHRLQDNSMNHLSNFSLFFIFLPNLMTALLNKFILLRLGRRSLKKVLIESNERLRFSECKKSLRRKLFEEEKMLLHLKNILVVIWIFAAEVFLLSPAQSSFRCYRVKVPIANKLDHFQRARLGQRKIRCRWKLVTVLSNQLRFHKTWTHLAQV